MISKTVDEIRTEITDELNSKVPNLDTTQGTPERDIFVEAPIAGQLLPLWNQLIYSAKLHAPLVYYDEIDEEDLENYCNNFGVVGAPATRSTGTVTFYSYSEPSRDIFILNGTRISTNTVPTVEFEVVGNYTIYRTDAGAYYNIRTGRYEITCNVRAVESGPEFRAGSNTVTRMVASIPGIEGCINLDPITGGAAAEGVTSKVRRVISKFQGRGLASTVGLRSYIENYVQAVTMVTANDPLMLRDGGVGGAIDIWILGEDVQTKIDIFNITSTGLMQEVSVGYTSTGIVLTKQPAREIVSVVKNGATIDAAYYTLVKDTGLYSRSKRGFDRIELTQSGIINTGYFSDGDTIQVAYTYNNLPTTIENNLNSVENHYTNRDYLVREMIAVSINVYMKIKEVAGQDFDTNRPSWALALTDYIESIKNADGVELADIISVIKSQSTVDNIDITTAVISCTGGGSITPQGDIILNKGEYATTGTLTLERWTTT